MDTTAQEFCQQLGHSLYNGAVLMILYWAQLSALVKFQTKLEHSKFKFCANLQHYETQMNHSINFSFFNLPVTLPLLTVE